LIRHARLSLAAAVLPLPVTMVQTSFLTLLVPAVGATALLLPGRGAARLAAIAVSAIAMGTKPEHRMATAARANPRAERHFAVKRHPSSPAGWTGQRFRGRLEPAL